MRKCYSELVKFPTFKARFNYLVLKQGVGQATFGFDRYVNQLFYRSKEWKLIRHEIIVRDGGCDLGVPGYEINGRILIHHINPMDVDMIRHSDDSILNPEYLITTTHQTHNAIHFGDEGLLPKLYVPRSRGDTTLW